MNIYLIRHGSTEGNLEHRYVGITDEALTEKAKRRLEENRELYPEPDRVFASPLKRCVQTANILFPEAEVCLLPDLRECGFGEFEYKNYEELQGDARYQAWIDSGGTLAFPGGESRADFEERCCSAFYEGCAAAGRTGAESAAFVVHGGTIMAILERCSEPHRDYFEWQVGNAEGFSCEAEQKASQLLLKNIRPLPQTPGLTGIEEQFVMKKNKKLRCGYTTGSCAAAAAKAATEMLLSGRICYRADLLTPKGIRLHLPVEEQEIADCQASCAVKKYGGDDPDATNGILVYARAEYLTESETGKIRVLVDGGVGVGRVTKPGLEQEVGAAAINRVPREMITKEVERICELYEYPGRIKITISVPDGVEIAKRTFNPHLGIQGGISILGTSGIVVPMSEDALIASIRVEMKQKIAGGEQYLLITPGNYGADFIRRQDLPYAAGGRNERAAAHSGYAAELPCASGDYDEASETQMERKDRSRALDAEHSMKCSNYVGETLDIAEELGARGILFVAHIGKFIKVSGGIMNTHSAHADCRAELMAAQAMRAGIPPEIAGELLDTNTTEEAVGILIRTGWLKPVMEQVTERVKYHLQKHCRGAIETEAIIYSNQYGYLGETDGADEMIKKIAAQ